MPEPTNFPELGKVDLTLPGRLQVQVTTEQIEKAAARYKVATRTIYRWFENGLKPSDLFNLEAVANLLLKQRTPKIETLKIITAELNE